LISQKDIRRFDIEVKHVRVMCVRDTVANATKKTKPFEWRLRRVSPVERATIAIGCYQVWFVFGSSPVLDDFQYVGVLKFFARLDFTLKVCFPI